MLSRKFLNFIMKNKKTLIALSVLYLLLFLYKMLFIQMGVDHASGFLDPDIHENRIQFKRIGFNAFAAYGDEKSLYKTAVSSNQMV